MVLSLDDVGDVVAVEVDEDEEDDGDKDEMRFSEVFYFKINYGLTK